MALTTKLNRGERYSRPEDPDTVWIIERLIELPGLPMHAKLIVEDRRRKTMTMSEAALRNSKLYQRLEKKMQADAEEAKKPMMAAA